MCNLSCMIDHNDNLGHAINKLKICVAHTDLLILCGVASGDPSLTGTGWRAIRVAHDGSHRH
jgi:hypothetical protein